jgi:hypothetical protein
VRKQHLVEIISTIEASAASPLFLDFDQTLFSLNSTELFIQSCKPSLLIACIDFIVRELLPWRLLGFRYWTRLRDYTCCAIIIIITPWNLITWRRVAPALFETAHSNELKAIAARTSFKNVIIISFGMEFVVKALLQGSPWSNAPLIATPTFPRLSYFSMGKLSMTASRFDLAVIAESSFVTDSEEDADLLAAVRNGYLIEPQGSQRPSAEHLYVPLRYTFRAKYPRLYFIDQLLLVDILLAIVATAPSLNAFLSEILFMPLFVMSFMCVYEIGYYQNDMVAARKEASPTLSSVSQRYQSYPILPGAWTWSLLFAGTGILLAWWLAALRGPLLLHSVAWVSLLLATYFTFCFYNLQPTSRRTYVYPLLQFEKYGAPFLIVGPTLVGGLLVFCQITTMWTTYLIYRLTKDRESFARHRELYRAVLFVFGLTIMVAIKPSIPVPDSVFGLSAAGVWLLLRAAKPIVSRLRRKTLRAA